MPFGLANAPATFQAYINSALREFLDLFAIAFLDDILIFSENFEEHVKHVRSVLGMLRKYKLFAKLAKCGFHVLETLFLGFLVGANGIYIDPSRVETIQDWPETRTHRDVQVFLGFANFYRTFIEAFAYIVPHSPTF